VPARKRCLRNLQNGARVLEGNPACKNLRLMQFATAAQNGGNTFRARHAAVRALKYQANRAEMMMRNNHAGGGESLHPHFNQPDKW